MEGTKVVITKIHKDDAFYKERETIIGKKGTATEVHPSSDHFPKGWKRGWVRIGKLNRYFAAIKIKETT